MADFDNRTGEAVFDGTLEPMFNVALEEAGFINAFSRGNGTQARGQTAHSHRAAGQSRGAPGGRQPRRGRRHCGRADPPAEALHHLGCAVDAVTGNVLAQAAVTAANKDEVLRAVPRVVAPIRKALGDTTPESVQLTSTTGAFTAASLEAVHEYGRGMELQFAGKPTEALSAFTKAAELDPGFARAYSGMAAQAFSLGRRAGFREIHRAGSGPRGSHDGARSLPRAQPVLRAHGQSAEMCLRKRRDAAALPGRQRGHEQPRRLLSGIA